ncbi:MAG: VOC family protein [Longimicrobiales bacterium]|nr:VOC family protein [Longimicrobiales bacterium]
MDSIGWVDLTVGDAAGVRDFYARVMGWRAEPVDMGGYADFNMCDPGTGAPAAGVCHARGPNAELPSVWMVYFKVADLDLSLAEVEGAGGTRLQGPRRAAGTRYAVVRDPAGAVFAVFEAASEASDPPPAVP